jgi:arginase family enzyme
MSEMSDPRHLTAMLARLQASADDARREQVAMRATFDAMGATSNAQFNEMNVRLSNVELAQMRLAERVDEMAGRIERILIMLGG